MMYDSALQIEECEHVYPPREDSLLLLECIEVRRGERVLEMGSATGIVSIHCAKAGAKVTAVDVNPYAVSCTRNNAERNALEIETFHSDLFVDVPGKFDVMIINPPYLPVAEKGDIEASWAGGEDGTKVLERFLIEAPAHLEKGGRIYVLMSSLMRASTVSCVLSQYRRERLGERKLFFEQLWAERLTLPSSRAGARSPP
ncbi:MAG TPA: HemK2/MTQ2 family protein methyltransferase [Methanomassiliicoccales archaeon]|nr:HemK2/MTQ2 family protein methyltransferase [Methanomassiliicoccales archaeon]